MDMSSIAGGADRGIAVACRTHGQRLSTFRDVPVATRAGDRVGLLQDFGFDRLSGMLQTFLLTNGSAVDVHPEEILLGLGKVLVPPEYAARVRSIGSEDHGLLTRIDGVSKVGRALAGVRRILTPSPQG